MSKALQIKPTATDTDVRNATATFVLWLARVAQIQARKARRQSILSARFGMRSAH